MSFSRFFVAPFSRESTRKLLSLCGRLALGTTGTEPSTARTVDHDLPTTTTCQRCPHTHPLAAALSSHTRTRCSAAPHPSFVPKALEISSHSLLTRPFAVSIALQSRFRVLSTRLRRPAGWGEYVSCASRQRLARSDGGRSRGLASPPATGPISPSPGTARLLQTPARTSPPSRATALPVRATRPPSLRGGSVPTGESPLGWQ